MKKYLVTEDQLNDWQYSQICREHLQELPKGTRMLTRGDVEKAKLKAVWASVAKGAGYIDGSADLYEAACFVFTKALLDELFGKGDK